jgi:uncharacterized protein
MIAPRLVRCPQCKTPVEWTPASKWRPFCSERCRLIDLGAWASGAYSIPASEPRDGVGASEDEDPDARRS